MSAALKSVLDRSLLVVQMQARADFHDRLGHPFDAQLLKAGAREIEALHRAAEPDSTDPEA